MTSLPPPATQKTPDDSLEKMVYQIVEGLSEYLPILNDRNRLGFSLYKYVTGQGDHPETIVKTAKVKVKGISLEELAHKISIEIEKIQSKK